jgi:hypothetical protein
MENWQPPESKLAEWQKNCREAKRLATMIRVRLEVSSGNALLARDELKKIAEECAVALNSTVKELQGYAAFQWFIGSTPDFQLSPEFDLPQEANIMSFMKNKLAELNQ